MVETLPQQGVLRVVNNAQMVQQEQADAQKAEAARQQELDQTTASALAGYIRGQFEMFKRHRDGASGWSNRLLAALRAFNGEYDPTKLAEIKKFGGSEVYARITAAKCRGATSLLRDVYLGPDRPYGISPPDDPDIPPEVIANIRQLAASEAQSAQKLGAPIDINAVRDRVNQLMDAARQAAKKRAAKQAKLTEDRIDELLDKGGFYKAFADFLVDLPLFPIAIIKGPVVKIIPTVTWQNGQPIVNQEPRLYWYRVSPFDLWWTPGVSDIEDAACIERTRVTRADLNDLLDLPGYNEDEVRAVLDEYGRGGLADNWDNTDAERARAESREDVHMNQSGLISCLEYHGNVQGRLLLEYGLSPQDVPDEMRDYMVQAWLIGNHVIKCQISPSPRKRHPYYVTSFEKVPGTPVGNALPDILSDIQEVSSNVLRSLVNNLSMASGPQVVINDALLAMGENAEELYPWKRWHLNYDPMSSTSQVPISFFQPNAHADQLLNVYNAFNSMADEISAIPKYLSGNSAGGAGRTASGLAMLMGNASKVLQTVAANIDRDVVELSLGGLYDMIMLTDTSGMLTGQEEIQVLGVNVAIQRETLRARQLEFLRITANPIDAPIMGAKGRAALLRDVSQGLVSSGTEIIPDEDTLEQIQQANAQQQAQNMGEQGNQAQGTQDGGGMTADMGPRTNIAGGVG
jgi:hypothetical protein